MVCLNYLLVFRLFLGDGEDVFLKKFDSFRQLPCISIYFSKQCNIQAGEIISCRCSQLNSSEANLI